MGFEPIFELHSAVGVKCGAMDSNSPSGNDAPKPNWALLAGLRFALAFGVLCEHVNMISPDGNGAMLPINAAACVLAFFLISGYSMHHSYAAEPVGFYRRRIWRVMPVYWFGLALAALPFALWGPSIAVNFGMAVANPGPLEWIRYALVLQPLTTNRVPVNSALWSLGVEIAYYVAIPWISRASSRVMWGQSSAPLCRALYSFGA